MVPSLMKGKLDLCSGSLSCWGRFFRFLFLGTKGKEGGCEFHSLGWKGQGCHRHRRPFCSLVLFFPGMCGIALRPASRRTHAPAHTSSIQAGSQDGSSHTAGWLAPLGQPIPTSESGIAVENWGGRGNPWRQ